ncbi:MAG: hypothetical protein GY756_17720 [bacterium]|nr:hypothetical protein [bacterium]
MKKLMKIKNVMQLLLITLSFTFVGCDNALSPDLTENDNGTSRSVKPNAIDPDGIYTYLEYLGMRYDTDTGSVKLQPFSNDPFDYYKDGATAISGGTHNDVWTYIDIVSSQEDVYKTIKRGN